MMTTANRFFFLFCCLFAVSCNRKATDGGLDLERLHDSCEAWCEVAVPCSEHFAGPGWGDFSAQSECEDTCIANVEYLTGQNEACFDIMLDLRECAAALTCEEFKNYENWAFAQPTTYPVKCVEENQAREQNCNL